MKDELIRPGIINEGILYVLPPNSHKKIKKASVARIKLGEAGMRRWRGGQKPNQAVSCLPCKDLGLSPQNNGKLLLKQ